MSRFLSKQRLLFISCLIVGMCAFTKSNAQTFLNSSDSSFKAGTPNTGRLWGYMFGDFYYKAHSDSLNRGGGNQYTGIPKGRNAYQFRRIYFGYDYNISRNFSTELLLSAEDNFPAFNPPSSGAASGDLLANGKETFFIKLANIRWKNIWKGTDLIVGEQYTPSFAMLTEKIWNYRSVERTISDIRRTPSYDAGLGLNGFIDPAKKDFGYDLLIGNGSSDKPAATSFKWFYGDVYHYFLNRKIVVDLYADYQRLNWQPTWHHDRQMVKGFIAYTTPGLTIGAEGFVNTIRNDTKATFIGGGADTINTVAEGISLYIHGDIVKNKLRFFARTDFYNPNRKINNNLYSGYAAISSPSGYGTGSYDNVKYNNSGGVTAVTPTGDPTSPTGDITSNENFITVGLDFTPFRNVHFEPNIWYNHYASQLAAGTNADYDLVYRMTFYFIFGK